MPSFDDILSELGGNGHYQAIVFFFMIFVKSLAGIQVIVPVLIGLSMEYKCRDEIDPTINNTDALFLSNYSNTMYLNDSNFCAQNSNKTCSKWVFRTNVMTSSIMTQYLLVCGREYFINFANSAFFCGLIIGTILSGFISDNFGRLCSFYVNAAAISIFPVAAAFAPFLWLFIAFRFLTGIGVGGILTTLFTITIEIFSSSKRVVFAFCVHQGWSVGMMLFALMGYFLRNHIWLQVAACAPCVLLVFAPCFIRESPRWLYARGHRQKLARVLRHIAKRNGVDSTDVIEKLKSLSEETPEEVLPWRSQLSILFRSGVLLKRFFCVTVCFIGSNFTVFGTYLGLDSLLGGNIFLKIAVCAGVEIPARIVALFVAQKLGRRPNSLIAFFSTGICFMISAGMAGYTRFETGQFVMAMMAKFWAVISLDSMWLYSAELFPTSIRNSSIGISNLFGRIASAVAAFIPPLRIFWLPLPFFLLGCAAFSAGLATIFLPELKNADLPEMSEFRKSNALTEGEIENENCV